MRSALSWFNMGFLSGLQKEEKKIKIIYKKDEDDEYK